MIVPEEFKSFTLHPDFLEEYPNAQEELDPMLLVAFGSELETSIFFDADHAHNLTEKYPRYFPWYLVVVVLIKP